MATIARRFTIITLLLAIFAFMFTALVTHSERQPRRFHVGSAAPCYHPATAHCVTAL